MEETESPAVPDNLQSFPNFIHKGKNAFTLGVLDDFMCQVDTS